LQIAFNCEGSTQKREGLQINRYGLKETSGLRVRFRIDQPNRIEINGVLTSGYGMTITSVVIRMYRCEREI